MSLHIVRTSRLIVCIKTAKLSRRAADNPRVFQEINAVSLHVFRNTEILKFDFLEYFRSSASLYLSLCWLCLRLLFRGLLEIVLLRRFVHYFISRRVGTSSNQLFHVPARPAQPLDHLGQFDFGRPVCSRTFAVHGFFLWRCRAVVWSDCSTAIPRGGGDGGGCCCQDGGGQGSVSRELGRLPHHGPNTTGPRTPHHG